MARVLGVLLLLALSGGIGAVEGFLSGDDLYASCQDKNLLITHDPQPTLATGRAWEVSSTLHRPAGAAGCPT